MHKWLMLGVVAALAGCDASAHRTAAMSRPAPAGSIAAGKTTIISQDAPHTPYVESFLAIDPKHPASLIATAIAVDGAIHTVLYASQDAGARWKRIDTRQTHTVDPVVYFAPNGRGFFESEIQGGLDIMTSADGGSTWRPFRYVPMGMGHDRPYIGFASEGPHKGQIYAAGFAYITGPGGHSVPAIAMVTSSDDGATFSAPEVIAVANTGSSGDFFPAYDLFPADVLVTPDGTVLLPYLPFHPGRAKANGAVAAQYDVLASRGVNFNGALDFSKPILAARVTLLADNMYRGLEALGGVRGTVDLSHSRYRGRAYLVYPDYTGSGTNIEVVHSGDDGRTWSAPVQVNDNARPGYDANPAIWVNDRGVLAVIWNDRRASRGSACYRLYASASLDGGEHFLRNTALSADVTCPNAPGNWKPVVYAQQNVGPSFAKSTKSIVVLTAASRWPNAGETQGLQSGRNGAFDAAWIDGASGVMQLAFTRFIVTGTVRAARLTRQPVVARASSAGLASDLDLNVGAARFDPLRGVFSVSLRLKNVSSRPIRGPFAVVFERAMGNLSNLRATNADETIHARGAWILGNGVLQPGESTAPRKAAWAFTAGLAEAPQYPILLLSIQPAHS